MYVERMNKSYRPTVVDVFCGCGGLSEGFNQAGFEVLLGIDSDKFAIETFNKYHQNKGRIKKIEDIDGKYIFDETGKKHIDVLTGGPPCQAFSTVAVAKWRSLGIPSTIDHPKNKLYKNFLRLIRDVSPKFFVIENVERMLTIQEGAIKSDIENELRHRYSVSFYKKNVANFGVPQHRKRALVIGNRIGLTNPEIIETHSDNDRSKKPYLTLHDAIGDLPRLKAGAGKEFVQYKPKKYISDYALDKRKNSFGFYNHVARTHNSRDLKIFRMLQPKQWIKDLPQRFNPYRKDIFLDKYKKQSWRTPSSTILSHLSKDGLMFIHPDKQQNRTLTPREAARIQSFSDSYVFEGPRTKQYIQIGNAVPPLFARSIAFAIRECLAGVMPYPIQTAKRSRKYF
jgi:DNA (cytosine-5)-methyltransferase 1